MSRFGDLPIKRKLALAMVLVSIAAVLLTGGLRLAYELATFKQVAVDDLSTEARIIAENCQAALEFDNAETARETLATLRTHPDLVAAGVYRKDGSLLAEYRSAAAVAATFPHVNGEGQRFEDGQLLVFRAVTRAGEKVGTVYLRSNLQPHYARLRAGIQSAVAAMLGALALALILAWRVQRVIAEPIVSLAGVAEQVANRADYSVRAPRRGHDEIGALTDAFNHMLAMIQERDAKSRFEEQRFRQLAESIREVFWLTNPTKNEMIYVSPVYEQVWGRTCASLYAAPTEWLEAIHPDDRGRVAQAAMTQQAVGTYDETYRIVRPDGSVRWIRDRAFPIRGDQGEVYRIAGLAEDVTETRATTETLRRLAVQILRSQDEERRRIARELHDSTAQDLVALAFLLGNLRRSATTLTPAQQQALADGLGLLKQCTEELRTLSYVLHPPLLDDQGLPAALKNYVDGFAQRTGIEVQLTVDPAVTRFARETELVLFRVLQESLTNIQKHSGSRQARIRLALADSQVVLEVHDSGQGFDVPDGGNGGGALLGVGVVSMRERLKQLGGELVLASGTGGTTVQALLPVTIPSP